MYTNYEVNKIFDMLKFCVKLVILVSDRAILSRNCYFCVRLYVDSCYDNSLFSPSQLFQDAKAIQELSKMKNESRNRVFFGWNTATISSLPKMISQFVDYQVSVVSCCSCCLLWDSGHSVDCFVL